MISRTQMTEILGKAMSTGADFAEVFAEITRTNSIRLVNGKIEQITDNIISGVGIRAFMGTRTV